MSPDRKSHRTEHRNVLRDKPIRYPDQAPTLPTLRRLVRVSAFLIIFLFASHDIVHRRLLFHAPSPRPASDIEAFATMTDEFPTKERLAKRIARAGLCSRRDAERWIQEGRVAVNGHPVETPAFTVSDADTVVVDGKPLPEKQAARLWRYHKPSGLVVTARDEKGRPTIFERLPRELPRVLSVGRLDLNSEGLLLLTNDGDLARKLELPATGWIRKYRVRVRGLIQEERLAALADGITIEGIRYGEIRATLERQQGQNAWLSVALSEGKNREIRRVMEHLGYSVNRLIRTGYGPFQLGTLARGGVEEVSAKVMRDLIGGESRKGQAKWAKAKPKPKPPRNRKRSPTETPKDKAGAPASSDPSAPHSKQRARRNATRRG